MTFGIFIMNSSLISAIILPNQLKYGQAYFYELFGRMILLAQITTNIVPYLVVLVDYIVNGYCRKRTRSLK